MDYESMELTIEDPLCKRIHKLLRSTWPEDAIKKNMSSHDLFNMATSIAFLVRHSGATIEHPNDVSIIVTIKNYCIRVAVVVQKSADPTEFTSVIDICAGLGEEEDEAEDEAFKLFEQTVDNMVNEILDARKANPYREHQG